jgi:dienelactone hydrolase
MKMRSGYVLCCAAVLTAAAAFILTGCEPADDPPVDGHTPPPRFAAAESFFVLMPGNGDETDVYYPRRTEADNATGPFPVALLLQGGKVDKRYYEGYARHVARYGFIVVVPNHVNIFTVPGFSSEGFYAEQRQIEDVLAWMEAENGNAASPLGGIVDTETLVMLGHSYGAACAIGAIQNTCEYPFCPEGETFERPPQLKAAALCGINTKPRGNPFDVQIRYTDNDGIPIAFINGRNDANAGYCVTRISVDRIKDPPKMAVFIKGSNHYAMCDINNPPGPGSDPNTPTLDQAVSVETSARWSALFLRAYALDDQEALRYVRETGRFLDPNVEMYADFGQ